jgi:hypothetical protein
LRRHSRFSTITPSYCGCQRYHAFLERTASKAQSNA